ncbi:HdeD family acid-resistance protein [Limibacillus halophilus]|jgi:uncharacterized membrane protein HdeD (DUF308 family)
MSEEHAASVNEAGRALRDALRRSVKKHAWLFIVQGVVMVLAGLAAIAFPLFSAIAVVVFLGWMLIISGVAQGITLITAKEAPHFWLQLISLALSCVVGLMMVSRPEAGLLALTLLIIVYFLVEGMAKVVFALTVRPLPNWTWVLASGLVSVVLSIYLWASMPLTAAWLLGLLLGFSLISQGAALAYMAWRLRGHPG